MNLQGPEDAANLLNFCLHVLSTFRYISIYKWGVPKLSKTHATFFGVRVTAADMDNCMYVMYNTVHIVYIVVGVGYHTVCICCT